MEEDIDEAEDLDDEDIDELAVDDEEGDEDNADGDSQAGVSEDDDANEVGSCSFLYSLSQTLLDYLGMSHWTQNVYTLSNFTFTRPALLSSEQLS